MLQSCEIVGRGLKMADKHRIQGQQQQEEWSPYVGPRPFKREPEEQKLFFGRKYESEKIISLIYRDLVYLAVGFVTTFLALEAAWHFTACKIKDKSIKPCLYKQIGLVS